MTVQDDARENIMVRLFNLRQASDRARHDADAYLEHEGHRFQFELKSTTKNSISTVRDLGPEHIEKWLNMHWIVGFFKSRTDNPDYCYYLAPLDMKEWTDELWDSIKIDFEMAEFAARRLTIHDLHSLVGEKNIYTIADARSIQKNQYSAEEYTRRIDLQEHGLSPSRFVEMAAPYVNSIWLQNFTSGKSQFDRDDLTALIDYQADENKIRNAVKPVNRVTVENAASVFPAFLLPSILPRIGEGVSTRKAVQLMKWPLTIAGQKACFDILPGYSQSAMLDILRDRCRYLISRGSTLNNPHISERFFTRFDKITEEHAIELRKKLSDYLLRNPPQELLGEAEPASHVEVSEANQS